MSNEVMHVGLEEPAQMRKEILSIAVDSIQALKDFESHKKVNSEKGIYRKHFIRIVEDLSKSIHELKEMLPAVHIAPPMAEDVKEAEVKLIIIKKPVIKKPKTHIEELENDINALREKIARL